MDVAAAEGGAEVGAPEPLWMKREIRDIVVSTTTAPKVYARLRPNMGHMSIAAMVMRPTRDTRVSSGPPPVSCITPAFNLLIPAS